MLPEEQVRQNLLADLAEKGYPKGLTVVEAELSSLPELAGKNLPKRRIDILIYTAAMKPLLLIECKAIPLDVKASRQLQGYNAYIGAPFMALANQDAFWLFWDEGGTLKKAAILPSYAQLLASIKTDAGT